jgi:hypothetical protein
MALRDKTRPPEACLIGQRAVQWFSRRLSCLQPQFGSFRAAMARHEALRGVPVQVGNRPAPLRARAQLCDLHAA